MWIIPRHRQFRPQRGAASGLVLATVVLILVGIAIFFYSQEPQGPVQPVEGAGLEQGTPDTPTGKTAPKAGDSKAGPEGQAQPESGGGESTTTAKTSSKKVVLTPLQKQVMNWEGVCHDPAASVKDRLAAIAALRKTDKTGEQFVPLLNQMLDETQDDELALGLVLEMRKRKHAEFGNHLLDAAMKRRSQEVKIAAIRTLGAYLDEPSIKSMLEQIGRNSGAAVGEEVRAALEGRKDHWDQGQER